MSNFPIKRIVVLAVASLALMACEDRYRYDCQDPDNWQEDICKKPKCVAMGYCTEWLINTGEEHVEEN
jgi:hypothetical protein